MVASWFWVAVALGFEAFVVDGGRQFLLAWWVGPGIDNIVSRRNSCVYVSECI